MDIYLYAHRMSTRVIFFRAGGVGFPLRPLSAFLIPLCNSYTNPISVFFFVLDGPLLSSRKQPLPSRYTATRNNQDLAGEEDNVPSLIFPDTVIRWYASQGRGTRADTIHSILPFSVWFGQFHLTLHHWNILRALLDRDTWWWSFTISRLNSGYSKSIF